MSSVECLREFVNERLTAAAEEIFGVFQKTIVEYEEEIYRQRKLLDIVCKPKIKLHRIDLQQQHVCKEEEEEVLTDQQLCNQERSSSLDQEDPEPVQIKEEQEELCTSQEGEEVVLKVEADTFVVTPADEERDHVEPEPESHHSESSFEKPYICTVCGRAFRLNCALNVHVRRVHTSERPYLCKTCGKRFAISSQLTVHQRIHTGEKPFICTTCGKAFRQNCTMTAHIRDVHGVKRPYLCNICENSFIDMSALKKHQTIHINEEKYTCTTCGKVFRQNKLLTMHIQHVHTDKKRYLCKTCGKRFCRIDSLKTHESVHTGEKPYLCKTCEKRFRTNYSLQLHQRIHTGEKPFICATCGRAFRQRIHWRVHINRIHTGERPYICTTCGKGFIQMIHLKVHIRSAHTGERPYACNGSENSDCADTTEKNMQQRTQMRDRTLQHL